MVGADEWNLTISRCLLVLTSPSTPLAPTPKIIWRTLHVGPMINDVPVSTIAWQPPMQATGLPLMLILAWDTVQNDSETSVCMIWILEEAQILPVHRDLPVQLTRERNPDDGLVIVVRISATEGYNAAFWVSMQESQNSLVHPIFWDTDVFEKLIYNKNTF